MDLNRDAMLVGLHIAAWSGRLYDRQASDHVAVAHEASTGAGRYNKRLLPKAAFAALTATMSEARTKHYSNSLPWDDKGARLLTRRQLRALHRADGRVPRARGAPARPLHRGLRRLHRPGPARPRQAVPHRGLSLQGRPPGQVRHPLPHHAGAGRRPFHRPARLGRHRAGEARHREPHRGTAPRRCRRPLPPLRRGPSSASRSVYARTTRASRWCSATR